MELNADFSRRAVVHAARLEWVPSPMPGVDRRMLDRIGGEVARATSIVRYAPGSRFSAHAHEGGEEFLVLEGVFQDEHGDYPKGVYVRNPPGSQHVPGSEPGCVIFVKLRQFRQDDRQPVRIDTASTPFQSCDSRPGIDVLPLFDSRFETVRMERYSANAIVEMTCPNGLELLVLDGRLDEQEESLEPYSWLRLPPGTILRGRAGPGGCTVWLKKDHLQISP